jgi:hypothetical protein
VSRAANFQIQTQKTSPQKFRTVPSVIAAKAGHVRLRVKSISFRQLKKQGSSSRRHCKKLRKNLSVIPAKAEIHSFQVVKKTIDPLLPGG